MAKIVSLRSSPVFVINSALSALELHKSEKKYSLEFLEERDLQQFWTRLRAYVDPNDRSLLILGLAPPAPSDIERMEANRGEFLITYLPSKHNPLTKDQETGLREKGIFVLPEREPFECFLGDIGPEQQRWVDLGKILSLHVQPSQVKDVDRKIAAGIVACSLQDPYSAAKIILEGTEDSFLSYAPPESEQLKTTSVGPGRVLVIKSNLDRHVTFAAVFYQFLVKQREPIGISGKFKALFTLKPSYAKAILGDEYMRSEVINFGRGAILNLPADISWDYILTILGALSRDRICVEIKSHGSVSQKTIRRRIIGGTTTLRKGVSVYLKTYRSVRDIDPRLQMQGRFIFAGPESFEEVIAVLKDAGAKYAFT